MCICWSTKTISLQAYFFIKTWFFLKLKISLYHAIAGISLPSSITFCFLIIVTLDWKFSKIGLNICSWNLNHGFQRTKRFAKKSENFRSYFANYFTKFCFFSRKWMKRKMRDETKFCKNMSAKGIESLQQTLIF